MMEDQTTTMIHTTAEKVVDLLRSVEVLIEHGLDLGDLVVVFPLPPKVEKRGVGRPRGSTNSEETNRLLSQIKTEYYNGPDGQKNRRITGNAVATRSRQRAQQAAQAQTA